MFTNTKTTALFGETAPRARKLSLPGASVLTTLALVLIAIPLGAHPSEGSESEMTLLRGAEGSKRVVATTLEGQVLELEARAMNVELEGAGFAPTELQLLSVYDPESGAFWWTFQRVFSRGPADLAELLDQMETRQSFWVSGEVILAVEAAGPPPSLWVLESMGPFETHQQAEQAMLEQLARSGKQWLEGTERVRQINLFQRLGADFFYAPDHAAPRLEVEIETVGRSEEGWHIRLAGRQGRKAEVMLDSAFDLRAIEEKL